MSSPKTSSKRSKSSSTQHKTSKKQHYSSKNTLSSLQKRRKSSRSSRSSSHSSNPLLSSSQSQKALKQLTNSVLLFDQDGTLQRLARNHEHNLDVFEFSTASLAIAHPQFFGLTDASGKVKRSLSQSNSSNGHLPPDFHQFHDPHQQIHAPQIYKQHLSKALDDSFLLSLFDLQQHMHSNRFSYQSSSLKQNQQQQQQHQHQQQSPTLNLTNPASPLPKFDIPLPSTDEIDTFPSKNVKLSSKNVTVTPPKTLEEEIQPKNL